MKRFYMFFLFIFLFKSFSTDTFGQTNNYQNYLYCISGRSYARNTAPNSCCSADIYHSPFILHINDRVLILDSTDFWYKVKYKDTIGWINKYDLSKTKIAVGADFEDSDFKIYIKKLNSDYISIAGVMWKSTAILNILVDNKISPHKIFAISRHLCLNVFPGFYEVQIYFYDDSEIGKRLAEDLFYDPPDNDCRHFIAVYLKNYQGNDPIIGEDIDFTPWD